MGVLEPPQLTAKQCDLLPTIPILMFAEGISYHVHARYANLKSQQNRNTANSLQIQCLFVSTGGATLVAVRIPNLQEPPPKPIKSH